jgi:hypothetical protein
MIQPITNVKAGILLMLCVTLFNGLHNLASAQPPDLPISVGDSGVGYIDTAVISNQLRFRFDAAYGANQSNRAEFLWAWRPALGPGPPLDESSTDYQKMSAYLEHTVNSHLSVFMEAGAIFSNPEVNDNSGGLGDIETGFKVALYEDCDTFATFQMRVYVPSGDADRALGNGHVSLEPAILIYQKIGSFTLEGELRDWIPIGGTPGRQGNVLRYGLGMSTDLCSIGLPSVRPVVEFAGWTVLDGQTRFLSPSGLVVEDADGVTVVNVKVGSRFILDENHDLYVGYGRSLTGDRWYRDILRVDLRLRF